MYRLTEYEKVEPVFYYNTVQQQTTAENSQETNIEENKTTGKFIRKTNIKVKCCKYVYFYRKFVLEYISISKLNQEGW